LALPHVGLVDALEERRADGTALTGTLDHKSVSGRRGDSHPPAPTDPGVTVSRHRALVILISRRWPPTPSERRVEGSGW
jgi:hypothetical protein